MGEVMEGGQRSCTNGGRGNVESQDPARTEEDRNIKRGVFKF